MGEGAVRRLSAAMVIVSLLVAAAVAVLGMGGAAKAEKATEHVVAGTLIGIFDVGFLPRKLSKAEPTPIRFTATANFGARGVPPQPLKELLFKLDKDLSLGVREIPSAEDVPGCPPRSGPRRSVGDVRKACRPAVVGNGRMDVEVQFPGQAPTSVASELVVLNGGVEGGKARLYLYSYFSAPVTSLIVTTMEIKKIRQGRYGFEALAVVPKIAGGAGSVTRFALSLKRGVLSATCPNGRLDFHGKSTFADGTSLSHPIIRTCSQKAESRR